MYEISAVDGYKQQTQKNSKSGQGCGDIGSLTACWLGCKMAQLCRMTVWWFLNRLNIEWSVTQQCRPWVLNTPDNWKQVFRKACTQMFITELFEIAKTWKQQNCPLMDGWVYQAWCSHATGYYSVFKKNEVLVGHHSYSMSLMLVTIRKKQTHRAREQASARPCGWWRES